jgi:L-cysteine/cystine lyase
LYVRAEVRDNLHPTFIGWRGITKEGWQPDGRRYEVATSAFPLYAGFRAAINYHHQGGTVFDRYQNILNLSQYLYQKLTTIPQIQVTSPHPPETGLVCFQVRATPEANPDINPDHLAHHFANHGSIVSSLEKQGVFTRTLASPDCIRACVHHFTTTAELDHLVDRLIETIQTI